MRKKIFSSSRLYSGRVPRESYQNRCARRQIPLILHGHKHVQRYFTARIPKNRERVCKTNFADRASVVWSLSMMKIVSLAITISFALPVFAQSTIDKHGRYIPTQEEIEANKRMLKFCEVPLLSDFD